MQKEKLDEINFRIEMLWNNSIPKNENTKKAFVTGVEIAFQEKENIDLKRVQKSNIITLFEHIQNYWNTAIPKNQATIVAFINGFDIALSPNFNSKKKRDQNYVYITSLFATFLYHNFNIRHLYWHAQIDTYAFRTNQDWNTAFSLLFQQFCKSFTLKDCEHAITKTGFTFIHKTNKNKVDQNFEEYILEKDQTTIINDNKIEVGTILQLNDLIKEDYKRTVHFNIKVRDPIWDIYEASENDFEFVKISCVNDEISPKYNCITLGRVRRICSGLKSVVKYIGTKNGKTYLHTNLFVIEAKKAFENNEVKIVDSYNEIDHKKEIHLGEILYSKFQDLNMGMISITHILDNFYGDLQGSQIYLPWINYRQTFSGWQHIKTKEIVSFIDS